jgi:hypothetical protein
MPKVMLLGNLPLAGAYQPPPGRLLMSEPGLYGLSGSGRRRRNMRGLGDTTSDVCNDPGTMFMQTLAAGFSGAASSGCHTTSGGAVQDQGWCSVSTGVQSANTTLNAVCQQARASAQGDPTENQNLQAQLEIERLRAQSSANISAATAHAQVGAKTDYTPYIFAGVGLVAVVGLALFFRKKR